MNRIPTIYFLRRFGIFLLTIWVSATIIWIIPRLSPTDPIAVMVAGMSSEGTFVEDSEAIIESWRERFGLNDPVPIQYLKYLRNLITLDFGYSVANFPSTVSSIIGEALPWTLGLLVVALFITFFFGNFIGAIMVWTKTPQLIKVLIPLGLVFTSIPSILAGLLLLYLFAFTLDWFPTTNSYAFGTTPGLNFEFIFSVIRHGTLPALSIVLVSFGYWALGMRGMMITVEGEDYMNLAKAKGLNPFYILYRYMIRNAILPQVTALALRVGTLVSGVILVEYVFQYRGTGRVIYEAILARDFAVIQGVSFIIIMMTALSVLVIDLIYPLIDPRISPEGR
jgi:peptide/nickel transport system permease protein